MREEGLQGCQSFFGTSVGLSIVVGGWEGASTVVVVVAVAVVGEGEGVGRRLGSSDERDSASDSSESISMMEITLLIFRLRSRLWLYLTKRDCGSAACSGSHGGERAFCRGRSLLQRWM